jgi:hypothetical protein
MPLEAALNVPKRFGEQPTTHAREKGCPLPARSIRPCPARASRWALDRARDSSVGGSHSTATGDYVWFPWRG